MTYQRALEIINQADEVPIWGYALDDTGWYLFILDRNDEDFPEPLAWDIMLDEYRDAPDARKRAKRKETWWVSTVNPQETIRQNHWDTTKEASHDN